MVDHDDSQLFGEGLREQSGVQLIEGYHHRVLLVHEDAEIVEFMKLSLEQVGGLRVRVVRSLVDAAEAADEWRPELLVVELADVAAARASLSWLAGSPALAQLPIVALTSCAQVQVNERIRVVIQLPFDPLDFEGVVATALALNAGHSTVPPDSGSAVFASSDSDAADSAASGSAAAGSSSAGAGAAGAGSAGVGTAGVGTAGADASDTATSERTTSGSAWYLAVG